MPRATFFMPFLCHNFSQIFELSNFFQNLTRKVFKKLVFYLINSKLTKSRTFESNTAPPHISNFPRTQGFKSRTNWRYPAHSGNSGGQSEKSKTESELLILIDRLLCQSSLICTSYVLNNFPFE